MMQRRTGLCTPPQLACPDLINGTCSERGILLTDTVEQLLHSLSDSSVSEWGVAAKQWPLGAGMNQQELEGWNLVAQGTGCKPGAGPAGFKLELSE